jgi:hypothetical protein
MYRAVCVYGENRQEVSPEQGGVTGLTRAHFYYVAFVVHCFYVAFVVHCFYVAFVVHCFLPQWLSPSGTNKSVASDCLVVEAEA